VPITRREFCERAGALVLAAGALSTLSPLLNTIPQAHAQASPLDLALPGPLGDMSMGDDKAPVTIVEYASMTCSHCADFQKNTFPTIKSRYIDTGKVRYILREFPLDPVAAAGFIMARCAAKDDKAKYFALIDTLFAQQRVWVVQKPIEPLKAIGRQAGLTDAQFNECLSDQKMLGAVEDVRRRAVDKFKVESTPTFFINGVKSAGALSIEEMSKQIDANLKS
jgi:protein-disulfide isomerase